MSTSQTKANAVTIHVASVYVNFRVEAGTGWQDYEDEKEVVEFTARTSEDLDKALAGWIRGLVQVEFDDDDNAAIVNMSDSELVDWFEEIGCAYSIHRQEYTLDDHPKRLQDAIRRALANDLIGGAISAENRILALENCLAELRGRPNQGAQ